MAVQQQVPIIERGWQHVRLDEFVQDVNPHTLPDGTVIEPTMNWSANLMALRSDGLNFYVKVTVPNGIFSEGLIRRVGLEIRKALSDLETYRTCSCKLGIRCAFHAAV